MSLRACRTGRALRITAAIVAPRKLSPTTATGEFAARTAQVSPKREIGFGSLTIRRGQVIAPRPTRVAPLHASMFEHVVREQLPTRLAELDLTPRRDVSYVRSPEDWRDLSIYFVLVDRFNRGHGALSCSDPASPYSVHGGNINGVTEKLDYIRGTGSRTVWLSPVVDNPPGVFHGYAPRNFLKVDPSKGTMDDLRRLVREAHARDMRVVLDIVLNHSCRAFDYVGGDTEFTPRKNEKKTIGPFIEPISPLELRSCVNYSRAGEIRDWNDSEQQAFGDFYGMRDFDLTRPETQDAMIAIAKWWITETGADGFRCDAAKHVVNGFWRRFNAEVRAHAATLGMRNFMLLGEAFDASEDKVAAYTKIPSFPQLRSGDSSFAQMFDVPDFLRSAEALHGNAPSARIEDVHRDAARALSGASGHFFTNFVDNHDVARFLRAGEDARTTSIGLAHALFTEGQPCIYYGTEQGFRDRLDMPPGFGDSGRTDMFDGGFKSPDKTGDSFDVDTDGYRTLARYNSLRNEHIALRRGKQYPRWNEGNTAGVYAFSRIYHDQEVVIMMNTANEARQIRNMWIDADISAPGTTFVDALDTSYGVTSHVGDGGHGSQLDFEVPAKAVRVLVRSRASHPPAEPTS